MSMIMVKILHTHKLEFLLNKLEVTLSKGDGFNPKIGDRVFDDKGNGFTVYSFPLSGSSIDRSLVLTPDDPSSGIGEYLKINQEELITG